MIDLSKQVASICKALDVDPDVVARLDITPGRLRLTTYQLNEHGSKFIHTEGPLEGQAAVEKAEFDIKT